MKNQTVRFRYGTIWKRLNTSKTSKKTKRESEEEK